MTDNGESPSPADGWEPGPRPDPRPGGLPLVAPEGNGLRWSFELDLVSALEAIGRPLRDWDGVDQEADLAEESAARGFTDVPPELRDGPDGPASVPDGPASVPPDRAAELADASADSVHPPASPADPGDGPTAVPRRGRDLAGAIAEVLPTGPGLAAWLAEQDPATSAGGDLAGMAGAFRRVASWAQARELELIAHIAARSAAADPNAGLRTDGRPAHVTDDAAAQVSLELTLSRPGAEAWAGLAVTLQWRLPGTAAALADGRIDTYRAKIIAEAVAALSDDAAKKVEDQVTPLAGGLTYGQLHAAVRRAVIAADPEGAEHRRQAAERRAKVSLYPDQDGTAALVGACLPAPEAAAAFAKICAIAEAMKVAGAGGGIHFLRAQALVGKILDTLPLIPPPPGASPGNDPPPDDEDDGWTPGPPGEPPHDPRPEPPGHDPGPGRPGPGRPSDPEPDPATDPWPDVPPLTDADLPPEDGYRDTGPPAPDAGTDWDPARGDPLDDRFAEPGIQWPWPPIPPAMPVAARPGCTPPVTPGRPPPAGLLDLTMPWVTFIGTADAPGALGRIGPITAAEACRVASLALRSPNAQWRIVLTGPDRCAIAVARVSRGRRTASRHDPPGSPGSPGSTNSTSSTSSAGAPSATNLAGVVGRVTIVIPADALDTAPEACEHLPEGIYARILRAARRARDRARQHAEADRHAPAGCAHATASPAYQPPPRIREHVTARDRTCRGPNCGQPAWRADLDHTTPFDQGGPTCPCNLGALCRRHHRLKQHPGWTITQPQPGVFSWTTPAGRTYITRPHQYDTG
jgi:Domain of unknown function (DUF222)